jgi:hypothetical protein
MLWWRVARQKAISLKWMSCIISFIVFSLYIICIVSLVSSRCSLQHRIRCNMTEDEKGNRKGNSGRNKPSARSSQLLPLGVGETICGYGRGIFAIQPQLVSLTPRGSSWLLEEGFFLPLFPFWFSFSSLVMLQRILCCNEQREEIWEIRTRKQPEPAPKKNPSPRACEISLPLHTKKQLCSWLEETVG